MTVLLLLMVLFWGTNYSVVKVMVRDLPPSAFNAVRLVVASGVFLAMIAASTTLRRRAPGVRNAIANLTPGGGSNLAFLRTSSRITPRDWLMLAGLGVVGQFLYQLFFAEGVPRTSVANASLILGCTPIIVSLTSAALGLERLGLPHWIGIALSAVGMYLVVGAGASMSGATMTGDLLMLGCVICWTAYTLAGQPLLQRHSPLLVTGWSMALGTLLYVPYSIPAVRTVDWSRVPAFVWIGTILSALLALNVAYIIWYAAVQRIGSARTSIYSNLVPIAATITAAFWLGESIGGVKLVGAALIITGLLITRVRRPAVTPPACE
ncbi:MAG TPA: DMT family transporter [Vicinamibacterales bacterium]